MNLLSLYRSILDYCGMQDEDGKVVTRLDEKETMPTVIDGKQLVLPTPENLKNYHRDKVIVFHPLQEHINLGESDIVKKLRYQLNVLLNLRIIEVATGLLKLAASSALHASLSPEQRELLRSVKTADLKTGPNFMSFITKPFSETPTRVITNIYLKKSGMHGGTKHARVGIVTFPYYELLEKADVRKNDKSDFKGVMTFMFPESNEETESYNAPSDSKDAPWLDAALKASWTLAQRINELSEMYQDIIPEAINWKFNDTWVSEIDNLDHYRSEIRRIPDQKGNEGTLLDAEGNERKAAPPVPQQTQTQPAARPVPAPANATIDDSGPYRVDAPVQNQYPAQQQPTRYPNVATQPAVQRGYLPPPPPPPPPQSQLALADDGKLDFRSVVATNPAVAAATLASTPITEWAQRQQMAGQYQYAPVADPRLGGWQQQQPVYDPRYQQQQPVYQRQSYGGRYATNVAPAPAYGGGYNTVVEI